MRAKVKRYGGSHLRKPIARRMSRVEPERLSPLSPLAGRGTVRGRSLVLDVEAKRPAPHRTPPRSALLHGERGRGRRGQQSAAAASFAVLRRRRWSLDGMASIWLRSLVSTKKAREPLKADALLTLIPNAALPEPCSPSRPSALRASLANSRSESSSPTPRNGSRALTVPRGSGSLATMVVAARTSRPAGFTQQRPW